MANGVYDDGDLSPLQGEQHPTNPGAAHYQDQVRNPAEQAERNQLGMPQQQADQTGGSAEAGGSGNKNKKDDKQPRTRLGQAWAGAKSKYGSRLGKLRKNKLLVGVGIGGSAMLILFFVAFLLLWQAFKVPHLMANITQYQFARVTEHAYYQNNRTIRAKIAQAVADSDTAAKMQTKYGDTWSKMDRFRPEKVMKNLKTEGYMKWNYDETGNKLQSITLDGKTTLTPKSSFKNLIPGYKFVQDFKTSSQLAPELNGALRYDNVGMFVRGIAGNRLRKSLGISFIAWKAGQYSGMSQAEADRETARANVKAEQTPPPNNAATDTTKQAAEEAKSAEEACVKSDVELTAAIKKGGVCSTVQKIFTQTGKASALRTTVGIANPIYNIATPVCIIYDGSINSTSGDTIDANTAAEVKAYNHGATVADTIKDGSTADMKAVRSNTAVYDGSYNGTAAQQAASGQVAKSDGHASPQAGVVTTAFDELFGRGTKKAAYADKVAGGTCKTLTNIWVAGGIGVANIAAAIATLGGSEGVEEGVGQTASVAIKAAAKKFTASFTEKLALSNLKETTGRTVAFLGKQTILAGGTAGLTLLARYEVMQHAGLATDGMQRGQDAVDSADSGANIEANELSRTGQFGAPLGKTAVAEANASTVAYVREQNAKQDTFGRYLAISNPNSLVSRMADTTYNSMNRSLLSSLTGRINSITSGSFLSTRMAGMINSPALAAQGVSATYGNLQWGWTNAEIKLMDTKPTYSWYENQRIFNADRQAAEVTEKYAKCFGADDDHTTQGKLIADGDVQFDGYGSVKTSSNSGDCAPDNLGPHNPKYGDLVFRYRINGGDNSSLDELTNLQDVTQDSDDGSATSDGAGSQFKLSSFNICYSGGTCAKGLSYETRLKNSVNYITTNKLEVVGLQEVREEQYKDLKSSLSNYGIYPTSYTKNYNSQNPIIWDSSRFSLVEGKDIAAYQVLGEANGHAATQVRLKDVSTGQEFYVINTHMPVYNTPAAQTARRDAAQELANTAKQLSADGVPVFITGDMNSFYTPNGGNQHALGGKWENLPYCIYTSGTGMWDSYDAAKNQQSVCPGKDPVGGVDHIFMSTSVTASNYVYDDAGPTNNGSDHKTLSVEVTIPGSGADSSSTTAVPYKNPVDTDGDIADPSVIRADDGTYHTYSTGIRHFTSKDLVHWTTVSGNVVTGAPASASGHMWGPNVAKVGSTFIMTWGGSGGDLNFNIYYATSSSAAGPFKYRGQLINSAGYQGTYDIDPDIYVTDSGPILYYGSGGQGITAVKLNVDSDGTITTTGQKKILFGIDPTKEWIGEGAWMQKHGDYYYLYYSIGRYNFDRGYQDKPAYAVHVARSASPMGPFEKDPDAVLSGDNINILRPGGNSITTDNAGNEWMIYHAFIGANHSERKLMLDPITYQANNWPIVNNGQPSSGQVANGPATGAGASTSPTLSKSFVGNDGFPGGSCVAYVEYILNRHSTKYHGGALGDGKDVANSLGGLGYAVDHTPAVHATVSFPTSLADATYGHVALVAQINPDGSIVVEEANWANSYAYGTHTVSADEVTQLTYAHTEVGWH